MSRGVQDRPHSHRLPSITLSRAASSAAPRALSGACHGLETLALTEGQSLVALRAIRIWLSVAPSSLG